MPNLRGDGGAGSRQLPRFDSLAVQAPDHLGADGLHHVGEKRTDFRHQPAPGQALAKTQRLPASHTTSATSARMPKAPATTTCSGTAAAPIPPKIRRHSAT